MSASAGAGGRPGVLALVLSLIPLTVAITGAPPVRAAGPTGGHPLAFAVAGQSTQAVVDVIDTTTQASLGTVQLTATAPAVAITPDARLALVALAGTDAPYTNNCQTIFTGPGQHLTATLPRQVITPGGLAAIDVASRALLPGVSAVIGTAPLAVAVSPDGTRAFVIDGYHFSGCVAVTGTVQPVGISGGPSLTPGSPAALPNSIQPIDAAVSPDGKTLYVLTSEGHLDALSTSTLAMTASVLITTTVSSMPFLHLVIGPDGSTAYVSIGSYQGVPGYIQPVALPALTPGPHIDLPPETTSATSSPTILTVATTAAGRSTLYGSDPFGPRVAAIPLPSGPGSALSLNLISDSAAGLFATPDGTTVEVTTPNHHTVPITGADHPPGTLGTCINTPATCPPGSGAIAVTPDQAPAASFGVTPAATGQPASFDASASTIAYGTIATYAWDFGDGSTQQTTGPTTTHTYLRAGTYAATLTETDWAGTSASGSPPSTVFTGQTMTRRGGPQARTARMVTISATPTTPGSPTAGTPPPSSSPPGFSPKISLLPKVGPPGTVVAVSGSGFPANTPVTLAWQLGIGTAGVTTDAGGTFTNGFVLVFPKDRLGPRQMVARIFNVTATFLVVPSPLAPGAQSLPIQLLFRG